MTQKSLQDGRKVQVVALMRSSKLVNLQTNNRALAFLRGQGGSTKDDTWVRTTLSRTKGYHSCCNSKVFWRHKDSCRKLEGTLPPDL